MTRADRAAKVVVGLLAMVSVAAVILLTGGTNTEAVIFGLIALVVFYGRYKP